MSADATINSKISQKGCNWHKIWSRQGPRLSLKTSAQNQKPTTELFCKNSSEIQKNTESLKNILKLTHKSFFLKTILSSRAALS